MIDLECIRISQDSLPYCCGIDDLGQFDFTDNWAADYVEFSGTGLYTASFINDEECRAAYNELCEKLILLYQSPVRKNNGTKNKVFFCVFSDKQRMEK